MAQEARRESHGASRLPVSWAGKPPGTTGRAEAAADPGDLHDRSRPSAFRDGVLGFFIRAIFWGLLCLVFVSFTEWL